jgi:hypothetical protein
VKYFPLVNGSNNVYYADVVADKPSDAKHAALLTYLLDMTFMEVTKADSGIKVKGGRLIGCLFIVLRPAKEYFTD